jgi:hypothetical protein
VQVYDAKGNPVSTPVFRHKNVLASYTHIYNIGGARFFINTPFTVNISSSEF